MHQKSLGGELPLSGVRGSGKFALPTAAVSLAFSLIALPATYVAVPFCRPAATALDLGATVGVASAAAAFSLAGVLMSLLAVYTGGGSRPRVSLAMAASSLGIATAFLVFGLALRSCPW